MLPGFYTVYKMRPVARTLNAVKQTKLASGRQPVLSVRLDLLRGPWSVLSPRQGESARRAIAPPQARPAAMTLFAPNPVSPAVVVTLSADRVKSLVLMVVVELQDRVRVVQTWTVQVGISVVIITVVDRVKDVVLMVHAELAKDVV